MEETHPSVENVWAAKVQTLPKHASWIEKLRQWETFGREKCNTYRSTPLLNCGQIHPPVGNVWVETVQPPTEARLLNRQWGTITCCVFFF